MMDYFRDRWWLLGLGLSFIALASLLFWLYAIPLEVIGYLLVLYAFFYCCWFLMITIVIEQENGS
mgnify:CR=1 FL=1